VVNWLWKRLWTCRKTYYVMMMMMMMNDDDKKYDVYFGNNENRCST